nr:MAG: RNA-dependent RNA polymerase [Botourmiaviridae sp.]
MKIQMIRDLFSPAVVCSNRFAPLAGGAREGSIRGVVPGNGNGWSAGGYPSPDAGESIRKEQIRARHGASEYPCFGTTRQEGVANRRRVLALKKKRRLCARTVKSIAKNSGLTLPGVVDEPIKEVDSHISEEVSENKETNKYELSPWALECSDKADCPCLSCQASRDCDCLFSHCDCKYTKTPPVCRANGWLKGKARGVLRHLRKFHGLRSNCGVPFDDLSCLSFRKVIRRQLPLELTPLQELTVKTSTKIVRRACQVCQQELDKMVGEYKKGLFTPVEVDERDLERFKLALGMNVPEGWNSYECPYIPNGHASLYHSRAEGGNWNEEEFSSDCGVAAILSNGKPRIVTTYSGYNSEVLHSLHRSLFGALRGKGWLLTGPPTEEKVKNLNGYGALMSYDYEAATDRIKARYVRTAIQVLKEKAKCLTEDQVACLNVLGHLKFHGSRHAAPRGQPMGSLMSFPLLCLINKTIVDLALLDLLEAKKISFKEWTSHRCLINGDDLLIRSPTLDHSLYDVAHRRWSTAAGMKVNKEKTMIDMEQGEINSTLFQNGELKKKSNLSALYMSGNTDDVVGVAYGAASTAAEFRRMVSLNAHLLARQSEKFPSFVPLEWRKGLLTLPRVRRALRAQPSSERPAEQGTLPMSEKPEGYDLDMPEECKVVRESVARARALGLFFAKCDHGTQPEVHVVENAVPAMRWFLRRNRRPRRELVLSCLARHWEKKRKEALWEVECASNDHPLQIVSDDSRIDGMLDAIRAWKSARIPLPARMPSPVDGGADGHVTEGLLTFV